MSCLVNLILSIQYLTPHLSLGLIFKKSIFKYKTLKWKIMIQFKKISSILLSLVQILQNLPMHYYITSGNLCIIKHFTCPQSVVLLENKKQPQKKMKIVKKEVLNGTVILLLIQNTKFFYLNNLIYVKRYSVQ